MTTSQAQISIALKPNYSQNSWDPPLCPISPLWERLNICVTLVTAHCVRSLTMSTGDYTTWTVEDVSNWLSQINLSSLVPAFERLSINGAQLAQIDDQFIKERLRMSKPSEMMALRGAIFSLRETSPPTQPGGVGGAPRRTSAQPQAGHQRPQSIAASSSNRVRTNSYDKTLSISTAPGPSKTLPTRRLTTPPGGFHQPMLAPGSAQELAEDCRHCGWIIKQGGGYKNCKFFFWCTMYFLWNWCLSCYGNVQWYPVLLPYIYMYRNSIQCQWV